jgi:hypothetical protein
MGICYNGEFAKSLHPWNPWISRSGVGNAEGRRGSIRARRGVTASFHPRPSSAPVRPFPYISGVKTKTTAIGIGCAEF